MIGNKDWKKKYFDSLKSLEDQQETWTELENLLRKALTRLAITAKGIDDKLDRVLSSIQQHSRQKKNDLLNDDLETLSRLLSQMEDDDVGKPQDQSGIRDHLFELIKSLHVEKQFLNELNEFKGNIYSMDDQQCIDRFAELISSFLQYEPADKTPVREVLITLVEKIAFTHGESEHLNEIKQLLDEEYDQQNWHAYLDDIITEVGIIIDGINDEKVELESIIFDVTRQLNDISSVLTDEISDNQQGRQETQNLQNFMDESVENIKSKVETASDINGLKTAIDENLVSIKNGIREFVESDDERFQKSEQRNESLRKQIRLMEKESTQLKMKLSENRKKLMFDPLTGARSRMSYEEILEQELSRWSRYQDVFSFAILDIDHFKQVNDQYGHNAGDKALQIVARMMSENIRKTDFLFRIGGEEFVLLLPKTTLASATPLVEKIRTSVGNAGFHFKKEQVNITMSGGITAILDSDGPESIYERADQALYEAKDSGRDRLISRLM